MAQDMKDRVLEGLRKLSETQLEELCGAQGLTVGSGKKCRKVSLFNAIVRTLSSEEVEDSEDEGLELFTLINEQIVEMLGKSTGKQAEEKVVKVEAKDESGSGSSTMTEDEQRRKDEYESRKKGGGNNSTGGKSEPTSLHKLKLKEFKVNGTVGIRDTTGALDWSSLNYQIREGVDLGYPRREIMSGVIKAMKPGSSLRKYFESRPELNYDNFMSTLKALYDVKDSSELLEQMVDSVQEPTESALTFVLRMMAYRDCISETNRDEEYPLGEALIQRKFSHAVIVGLRSPTIRLEIKTLLKNTGLKTDDQFLKEVNKILSQNAESDKKLGKGGKGGTAGVKSVDINNPPDDEEKRKEIKKQDLILAKLDQLTATVTTNQSHVEDLEKKLKEYERRDEERGNRNNNKRDYKFPKCAQCEREKAYCTHCSKCGSPDHKRNSPDCPKNQ